jgi:hypothetical protein
MAMNGFRKTGGYRESVIGYNDEQNNTMGVFYLATEMPVNAGGLLRQSLRRLRDCIVI